MNLLPALDALLREGSVTGAALELNVSASAMSRTLGRLRRVVGDPLLVPAGRGLVLTPRAHELQPQVEAALAAALAALQPPHPIELAEIEREFAIRADDGLTAVVGSALIARAAREAPGVRLRILPEGDEDPADLRDRIDLDLGSLPELPHDVRSSLLCRHRYVAVAPTGAPWAQHALTPRQFAALPHITVSRRGRARSVVDDRLAELGLQRKVLATVPAFVSACHLALESEALALVPSMVAVKLACTMPLTVRDIPLDLPSVDVGMAWHTRVDADPAHRWLRTTLTRIVEDAIALAQGAPHGPDDRQSRLVGRTFSV